MSYDWIIIAYPTIMDGLVLRWYASEEDARSGQEHLSISRNAVEVYRPGELAESARPEAEEAHRLLKAGYPRNYDRVKAMATHDWSLAFSHGDLVPLRAEERAWTTDPTFVDVAAQYGAVIGESILGNAVHVHCACGWVGAPVTARGSLGRREALADHAAHVHVAAGLVTEEDG